MFKLYGKDKTTKLLGKFETKEQCKLEMKVYKELEKMLFNNNTIEFYIEEEK